MKYLAIICVLITLALTAAGQKPKPTPKKTPKTAATVAPKLGTEAEEFEKARALADPSERIAALRTFIKNFPDSAEILRAEGLIVSARAELGDQKLRAGETQAGIDLFKLAVTEAPTPIPDDLFTKVILGFPINLDSLGQREAAFDIVKMIEDKIGANAPQILDLSKFYINVKYGTEAIRLAEKAVALTPDSAAAHQVLAIAYRLNFRLEDAANAYAKSVELDAASTTNRQSLAEMKRALGKPDEAAAIYREILAKEPTNSSAQTGLTLALFDADKRADAEAEMTKAIEADPGNFKLLTGAAYWYAAHGLNDKALEMAQKALAVNQTFIWAYIAEARALVGQGKPLEAEKTLLLARQYADFPTLDYELASARLAAGLFREAAETLKKNFVVNKEGLIETYIGNRILADANSFTELLSLERRADLFETAAADSAENTARLKSLLEFQQKLDAADATETELAQTADDFAKGDDNMRLHRQLFAASRLLQKKAALAKVLSLMQSAIGGVDAALTVDAPSSAVLADEIYAGRQYAISQNRVIVVPDIPRQTLSAILRGRIEDLAGWAYFQQDNREQSVVRLRRALSVLPDKSAWWRASQWRLGNVFEADGKEKEALNAYLRSFDKEAPDPEKQKIIENLYVKVNGSADGLEAVLGVKPITQPTVAETDNKRAPENTDNVPTPTENTPSVPVVETSPTPEVKTAETPQPTPEIKTEPRTDATPVINSLPENLPSITPEKTPEPTPTPVETPNTTEVKPEETPKTEATPSPTPDATPTPEVSPTPLVTPTPEASPTPEATPMPETPKTEATPMPTPEETPKAETSPTPTPEETSKTEVSPTPTPTPEATPTPTPEVLTKPVETPTPEPTPEAVSDKKTETLSQIPPSPKTDLPKTENKTTEPNQSTPLFPPVIINVGQTETPKTETPKTENSEPKPTDEKPLESAPPTENKTDEKPVEKNDDKILSGENRPRIIITDNTGTQTVSEETVGCKIVVNQEKITLLNGSSGVGVEVGFEEDGDLKQITAASGSPDDVEVRLDPEINRDKKLFFIVRSISQKTGQFTVTFEAPCGKKEILVTVR